MSRRFPPRRRRAGGKTDSHAPGGNGGGIGASAGSPRYLARPRAQAADLSSAPEHEARGDHRGPVREAPVETPLGRAAGKAMATAPQGGRPLGRAERAQAEARLGEDFSDVRLVENSPLAPLFGANAMTRGATIHVAPGRYSAPGLIGHELTHVAQQRRFGGGGGTAQFDLNVNDEDTGLGTFDLDMRTAYTAAGNKTGMRGSIAFEPADYAPYSNRIGLVQTADLERLDQPGDPDYVWTGGEANRENVKTDEGTFVDMLHGNLPADRNAEPWYWQGFPTANPDTTAQQNHFGWNRGPGDSEPATLADYPGWSVPARFTFETVAMGRDNRTIYGAIRWGFEINGTNLTTNEWTEVPQILQSGSGERYQSGTFDEALGNFRDFYVHEPVIVYFGHDEWVPTETELGKMDDVAGYMTDNPDAVIRLTASADMQGGAGAYNRRLALDRMNAVQTHLLSLGIDPGRIIRDTSGAGASRAEGSYQANRRVTLTFENTQSAAP